MAAFVNECITGEYNHIGQAIIYGDTDSVDADSTIRTNRGNLSIERLFHNGSLFWSDGDKEYSSNNDIKIAHLSKDSLDKTDQIDFVNYNYVYRHKVSKKRYKIKTANGKEVIVTEDHSIMVLCDGNLKEKKPADLKAGDLVVTIIDSNFDKSNITEVQQLDDFDEEYVYDIGVNSKDPYFFANDVLVHNSVYFSAWPIIKNDLDRGSMTWDKDVAIQIYDNIADQVNASFPAFMEKACHCTRDLGSIIKGGRELVASKGLFIKKKRYAVLIYDQEGNRLDINNKPGKVKAMGLDLKRSDTPKVVQDFLSEILLDVLTGADRQSVIDKVREFKVEFQKRPPWEKGTPKRVNNLTKYTEEELRLGKANMPGHVRAAMNWNNLRRMHSDNYSMAIVDGMKTIVCKLRDNPIGYTSVGYPIDESHIPSWFKDLPFDDDQMESTIVDQKVENLLGVLEWHIAENTDIRTVFNSLFSFG